jgi:hypothetical protein
MKEYDGKIVTKKDYPWAKSSWLCLIQVAATSKAQFSKAAGTQALDKNGEVAFNKLYRNLNVSEAYIKPPGYLNIIKALNWNALVPAYHHQLKRWVSIIGLLFTHEKKKMVVFIDHMDRGRIKMCRLRFFEFTCIVHLSTVNEYFEEKHRLLILNEYVRKNYETFFGPRANS